MIAKEVVASFWRAMQSNDFELASQWLTEDFENHAPQTDEVIIGRANFAAVNSHYPCAGLWQFNLLSIVAEGNQVVTEVAITDGTAKAVAITFHTVKDNLIHRQKEYWPDNYPPPSWRSPWVTIKQKT